MNTCNLFKRALGKLELENCYQIPPVFSLRHIPLPQFLLNAPLYLRRFGSFHLSFYSNINLSCGMFFKKKLLNFFTLT